MLLLPTYTPPHLYPPNTTPSFALGDQDIMDLMPDAHSHVGVLPGGGSMVAAEVSAAAGGLGVAANSVGGWDVQARGWWPNRRVHSR